MQQHQIKPTTLNKKSRKIGRGGKRGSYSGRGIKGQKARAGRKIRPEIRDIIKKLPKRRGYRFKSLADKLVCVNLRTIGKNFGEGSTISPKTLAEKGLFIARKSKTPKIKIIGSGEAPKKIIVSGCAASIKVREKIEKAGGLFA